MTATPDSTHGNHVCKTQFEHLSILKAAAIYGANGAGKTNLVTALIAMKSLVLNGIKPKRKIPTRRFKLDPKSLSSPTHFEIDFLRSGLRYSYGLIFNESRIFEEWLFATSPDGQENLLFERITSEEAETKISFGPLLSDEGDDFLQFLAKSTRAEQPFIAEAEARNLKATQVVNDWFRSSLTVIKTTTTFKALPLRIGKDKNFSESLGKFLRAAGTGIEGIETREEELDFSKHFPTMPSTVQEEILSGLNSKVSAIIAGKNQEDDLGVITGTRDNPKFLKMYTLHKGPDGKKVIFSFEEESSGTKRLIHLFPALFSLAQEQKTFLIDELDRSLHPLLSRLFLQTFLENASNSSQLIFTTHEECLLDRELIRKDEVWFIEKDSNEVSHCYPLSDFKLPPNIELRKGYLNGRFGAIPFFGDVKNLGWTGA